MKSMVVSVAALVLIITLSACDRLTPAEVKTTAEPTETSLTASATQPDETEKLFFMLDELPSLPESTQKSKYQYFYEVGLKEFKPSARYGGLILYYGDKKTYCDDSDDNDTEYDWQMSKYGLMTTDGKIVTDPIYQNAYMMNDKGNGKQYYVLTEKIMKNPENDYNFDSWCTIVAIGGNLALKIKAYGIDAIYDDKVVAYEDYGQSYMLYTMNGSLLKTFGYSAEYNQSYSGISDGIISVHTYKYNSNSDQSSDRYQYYNLDGKEILTDIYGGSFFDEGVAAAKKNGFWGVIKSDGSWLIQPVSLQEIKCHDGFIRRNFGGMVNLYDTTGKNVGSVSASDYKNRHYERVKDRFIYKDDNTELYHYAADDAFCLCKSNGITAQEVASNKEGIFFGTDLDGNGCLFDFDGNLLNLIKKPSTTAERAKLVTDGDVYYTVSFEETNGGIRRSYVYSFQNHRNFYNYTEKLYDDEYMGVRESIGAVWYDGCENYVSISRNRYSNDPDNYVDTSDCSLVRISDGKVIIDGCKEIAGYKVNGKNYFLVVRANETAVYDEDMNLIMRKLNENIY